MNIMLGNCRSRGWRKKTSKCITCRCKITFRKWWI